MGKPSQESHILELFYNESSKQWHFDDIVKKSRMSRDKVNKWLKRFVREGIIRKVKPDRKMPYYIANFNNYSYKVKKKIYAIQELYKCGLMNHLFELDGAKTIVIFGSFSRADWHTDSDIDLFIYGNNTNFNKGEYEKILGREIQVFNAQNTSDLKKMGVGLIKNIIKGDLIKGNFDFVEVKIHA